MREVSEVGGGRGRGFLYWEEPFVEESEASRISEKTKMLRLSVAGIS